MSNSPSRWWTTDWTSLMLAMGALRAAHDGTGLCHRLLLLTLDTHGMVWRSPVPSLRDCYLALGVRRAHRWSGLMRTPDWLPLAGRRLRCSPAGPQWAHHQGYTYANSLRGTRISEFRDARSGLNSVVEWGIDLELLCTDTHTMPYVRYTSRPS